MKIPSLRWHLTDVKCWYIEVFDQTNLIDMWDFISNDWLASENKKKLAKIYIKCNIIKLLYVIPQRQRNISVLDQIWKRRCSSNVKAVDASKIAKNLINKMILNLLNFCLLIVRKVNFKSNEQNFQYKLKRKHHLKVHNSPKLYANKII